MTMKRKAIKDIERWLEAEARGETGEADEAFRAVFSTLPRLEPRAGFAERVTYALRPQPAARLAWLGWWPKAAMLGSMVLVAVMVGLLPSLGWIGVRIPPAEAVVDAAWRGTAWLAGWFATGLEVWSFMIRIGNAIGVAMTTPQIGAALLGTALLGAAAFYELNRLLALERRTA